MYHHVNYNNDLTTHKIWLVPNRWYLQHNSCITSDDTIDDSYNISLATILGFG